MKPQFENASASFKALNPHLFGLGGLPSPQPQQNQPRALDLCCGKGGWAKGLIDSGWEVIGVDIDERFAADYPGHFICADLLTWTPPFGNDVKLIVASPPCEEFSRWSMPWTRAKNPPVPSKKLWNRCLELAAQFGCPIIIENVRGAQQFMGRSLLNVGPFHLWGGVPAILPDCIMKKKESYGSKQRAERAVIPYHLALHIGKCFLTNQ